MIHRSLLTCLLVLPLAACAVDATDAPTTDDTAGGGSLAGAFAAVAGADTSSTAGSAAAGTGSATAGGAMAGSAGDAQAGDTGQAMAGAATAGGGAMVSAGMAGDDAAIAGMGAAGMGAAGMGTDVVDMAGMDGMGMAGAGDDAGGASGMDTAGMGGDDMMAAAGASVGGSSDPTGEGFACDREFTIPAFSELPVNAKLPDPFTFMDGSKVETREDWACRQKEISLLAQAYIYGPKPPPPESVEATFSNGTLNITVTDGGRSIDFSVGITTPNGEGPFPAVFNIGATISGTGSIAYQAVGERLAKSNGSQGRSNPSGLFYQLYPDSTDTGSLMAWAWGASRVIDALEKTEGHKIDPTKLTALGCSRNGKEAATIALFDNRVAMVAMQSPGSGSTSGWRVADVQTSSVQTADQIFGEDTWMGEPFGQFGNRVTSLPVDQHTVLALAWPRPLLVREGTNDSWNCPLCVLTTVTYTQMVYEALGNKEDVGFLHYNGGHCESGGAEWTRIQQAFVDKYLFGDASVSTADMFIETSNNLTFDAAKWQDGDLPTIP